MPAGMDALSLALTGAAPPCRAPVDGRDHSGSQRPDRLHQRPQRPHERELPDLHPHRTGRDGDAVHERGKADTFHHRHATWSPDRTKIAYAAGTASPARGTSGSRTWMARAGSTSRLRAPGPRIARVGRRTARGSPTRRTRAQRTIIARATRDCRHRGARRPTRASRRASHSSPGPSGRRTRRRIYYGRSRQRVNHDIYRSLPAGGDTVAEVTTCSPAHTDDYQPSVSPDGTRSASPATPGTRPCALSRSRAAQHRPRSQLELGSRTTSAHGRRT